MLAAPWGYPWALWCSHVRLMVLSFVLQVFSPNKSIGHTYMVRNEKKVFIEARSKWGCVCCLISPIIPSLPFIYFNQFFLPPLIIVLWYISSSTIYLSMRHTLCLLLPPCLHSPRRGRVKGITLWSLSQPQKGGTQICIYGSMHMKRFRSLFSLENCVKSSRHTCWKQMLKKLSQSHVELEKFPKGASAWEVSCLTAACSMCKPLDSAMCSHVFDWACVCVCVSRENLVLNRYINMSHSTHRCRRAHGRSAGFVE